MAILPWRFQCDMTIPQGEAKVTITDPDVTVFVGSTYTNDITQKQELHRSTENPMTVKLSALPAFLESSANGISRDKLPKAMQPVGAQPADEEGIEDEDEPEAAPTRKGQRR
jgi:hypothetical protein